MKSVLKGIVEAVTFVGLAGVLCVLAAAALCSPQAGKCGYVQEITTTWTVKTPSCDSVRVVEYLKREFHCGGEDADTLAMSVDSTSLCSR